MAGGVGVTPFLSAVDGLDRSGRPPLLIDCVRSRADATAMAELERAAADGRLRLEVLASDEGRRFSPDRLAELVADNGNAGLFAGPDGKPLTDAHVAVCGPAGLVGDVASAARRLGAGHVETEAFDIRSGIGPDLSRTFARAGARIDPPGLLGGADLEASDPGLAQHGARQ